MGSLKRMLETFGDVCSFLQLRGLPPTRLKLLDMLDDPPQKRKLQMELAGVRHVRAYFLYSHHQPQLKEFFQFNLTPLLIDKSML